MKKTRFTYHWAIILACFLMMAASIGVTVNCFNLFSIELMKEFGYSASSVQLISTITTIASFIGAIFTGKVMAKMGMRVAMPIYALLMSGGFILYSTCNGLIMFYALSCVVGFGVSGVSLVPCGMLINNWFSDKKGLATGIAFTGSVAGGLILVQVTKLIIASSGWRSAFMIMGIVSAVILLPTLLFVVREKPEDMGLLPLGANPASDGAQAEIKGISMKNFLKTGSFRLLGLSFFIIGFIGLGMQNNVSIYLTRNLGHSAGFAANLFTFIMGVEIFGKIILGAIYDRKGVKFGTIYLSVLYVLAALAFMNSANGYVAILFGALFGLVCSMLTVTTPYLTALVCGRRDYPGIYGLLGLCYGAGAAAGPVVASSVFDVFGSYNYVWTAFSVISLLMAVTTILAVKKGSGFSLMTD
ncbi:MAG: MFS transporter [Oscillospiraceae bacterium]